MLALIRPQQKNICGPASPRPTFGRGRNVLSRIMIHADRGLSSG